MTRIAGGRRAEGRGGFTLIEGAIAAAIALLVAAGILAALAGAVRVWERAGGRGRPEADAWFALELLARDVRNAVPFPGIPAVVETERLRFAAPADGSPSEGPGGLFQIEYRFDPERKTLLRSCRPYPPDPGDESPGEEILTRVEEAAFASDGGPSAGGAIEDGPAVATFELPAAVRARIVLGVGEERLAWHRTMRRRAVSAPAAGGSEERP